MANQNNIPVDILIMCDECQGEIVSNAIIEGMKQNGYKLSRDSSTTPSRKKMSEICIELKFIED